ncbi:MAG: hypothetical protein ACXV5Q_10835 [Frankiaceae bacterium]
MTAAARHRVNQRAGGHKTPFRDRLRALIVLLANATAAPFNWTFTADDLDDLLARIDAHEHPNAETPR